MVEVLLKGSVMCLATIGFVELIRLCILIFTGTKNMRYSAIIVPIYGHDEDVEIHLRSLIATIRWNDGCKVEQLICLDCSMDNETRSICERLHKEYDFLQIYTPQEYLSSFETSSN